MHLRYLHGYMSKSVNFDLLEVFLFHLSISRRSRREKKQVITKKNTFFSHFFQKHVYKPSTLGICGFVAVSLKYREYTFSVYYLKANESWFRHLVTNTNKKQIHIFIHLLPNALTTKENFYFRYSTNENNYFYHNQLWTWNSDFFYYFFVF